MSQSIPAGQLTRLGVLQSFGEAWRVLLLVYARSFLLVIPSIVWVLAEYVPLVMIPSARDNFRNYLLGYNMINDFLFFFGLWLMFSRIFGVWLVWPVVKRVGIPVYIVYAGTWVVMQLLHLRILLLPLYAIVLGHHGLMMLGLQKYAQKMNANHQHGADVESATQVTATTSGMELLMACGSTPIALTKGFVLVVGFYSFYMFLLWPIYYALPFQLQILFRAVGLPLLISSINFTQYLFLANAASTCLTPTFALTRRLLQSSGVNMILIIIGRLMISAGESTSHLFVMSVFAGIVEVVSRLTFLPRYRIYHALKKLIKHFWTRRTEKKVPTLSPQAKGGPSFNDAIFSSNPTEPIEVQPQPNSGSETSSKWADKRNNNIPLALPELSDNQPQKEAHTLSFWNTDELTEYAKLFRGQQIVENMTNEVRAIILVQTILYVLNGARHQITLPTTNCLECVALGALVQLLVRVIGDFVSLAYEIRTLKIQFRVARLIRPARMKMDLPIYFLLTGTCLYLSIDNFINEPD